MGNQPEQTDFSGFVLRQIESPLDMMSDLIDFTLLPYNRGGWRPFQSSHSSRVLSRIIFKICCCTDILVRTLLKLLKRRN